MKTYNTFTLMTPSTFNKISRYWQINNQVISSVRKILPKFLYLILLRDTYWEFVCNKTSLLLLNRFFKFSLIFQLNEFIDLVVTDHPGKKYRFTITYFFLSIHYNYRIAMKIFANEITPLYSLTKIYPNANWYERELGEFWGILVLEHPDLRRLLTDYGFRGFALRKDFPLTGYLEVYYSESKKALVQNRVSLAQEYRSFNFTNPWTP